MESFFPHRRTFLTWAILLLPVCFVTGCLPFVTSSITVKNLSWKQPYKAYVGKFVVSKETFSIWNDFIHMGNGDDIPSYRTDLKKVADLPIGTKIKVYSIKYRRVTSELGVNTSTMVSCTVFLQDGRKIDCRMTWDFLNPDPRLWPTPKFELIQK